jgi:hypothetical protein
MGTGLRRWRQHFSRSAAVRSGANDRHQTAYPPFRSRFRPLARELRTGGAQAFPISRFRLFFLLVANFFDTTYVILLDQNKSCAAEPRGKGGIRVRKDCPPNLINTAMMTKPILLSALFGALALTLSAQPSKGAWLLGGDAHFLTNFNAARYQDWGINPNVAYFLSDRFALGVDMSAYSRENGESFKVSGYRISPFARYYMPLKNPTFAFSLEAGGGYQFDRSNSIEGETWRLHGGGALNIFVTPSLALEFYLGMAGEFSAIDRNRLLPEARLGFQVLLPRTPAAERQPAHSGALRYQSAILSVNRELLIDNPNTNFEAMAFLMLNNNLALGGGISSPTVSIMGGDGRTEVAEVAGLLPVLRYFPGSNPARRLRPYFGAGSSFRWTTDERMPSRFNFAPFGESGFLYFLRPDLAIDATARYQFNTQSLRTIPVQTESRLLFRLGFQYFIPTKH